MVILLLNTTELYKAGESFIKSLDEWIPYSKKFPNLRGNFSEKWGDPNNPDHQIDNFIHSFPTEEQIITILITKNTLRKYEESEDYNEIDLIDHRFYFGIYYFTNYDNILNVFRRMNGNLQDFFNLKTNIYDIELDETPLLKLRILRNSYELSCKRLQEVFPKLQEEKLYTPSFHKVARNIFTEMTNRYKDLFSIEFKIRQYLKNTDFLSPKQINDITKYDMNIYDLKVSIYKNNFILGVFDNKKIPIKDYIYFYHSIRYKDKCFYTREFVEFYLHHIKVLSRKEIFIGSRIIALKMVERLYPRYFAKCKKQWKQLKDKINNPEFRQIKVYNFRRTDIKINFYNFVLKRESYIGPSIPNEFFETSSVEKKKWYKLVADKILSYDAYKSTYFLSNLSDLDFEAIMQMCFMTPVPRNIFSHCMLYTIPRGGLEVLGTFMYANSIDKLKVPILSWAINVNRPKLIELVNHLLDILNESNKDYILNKLFELRELLSNDSISYSEKSYFSLTFTDIKYIFLIDDYFASGENMIHLYKLIFSRFYHENIINERIEMFPEKLSNRKIHLISMAKRFNLGRFIGHNAYYVHPTLSNTIDDDDDLDQLFNVYYRTLQDSFYYITTHDIRSIICIFPKIQQILQAKLQNKKIKVKLSTEDTHNLFGFMGSTSEQEYFQRKYIDNDWVDKLIISIVFPHSIADGESERILRMLYGERFTHSVRKEVDYLKNLLLYTKKIVG